MFKYLYTYYYNLIDTPANLFKLNIWSFANVRLHKIKVTQHIIFLISSLDSVQQKFIKIFHKNFNFSTFFLTFSLSFFFLIFFFIIIL